MFSSGLDDFTFDISSVDNGGVPQTIFVGLTGVNVADPTGPGFIVNSIWDAIDYALGSNWTVTQSGTDVMLAYNGSTNISFSNGSQSVLGVPGDSTGTGFSISTSDGINTVGNRVFSISAADVETFGTSGGPTTSSIVFGGKTITEGTGNDSAVQMGSVTINLPTGYNVSSDAITGNLFGSSQASQFEDVYSIDISTSEGATRALDIVDGALATINGNRADTGSYQNRFQSIISNLATSSENLSAARSRIMDADFAAETAELTRNQILQQAGMAMLAQANSLPQNFLSLLPK